MQRLNDGKWRDFLDYLKNILSAKTNRQYLIGDHMTLADITIGSIFMALIFNPYLMPAQRGLVQTLEQYPGVRKYADETILGNFEKWMLNTPCNISGAEEDA